MPELLIFRRQRQTTQGLDSIVIAKSKRFHLNDCFRGSRPTGRFWPFLADWVAYPTLSGLSARHYRISLIKFNDDVLTGFPSEIQDFYPRS